MKYAYVCSRLQPGQSPRGLYTNIWPTRLCATDRQALKGWYFDLHLFGWYFSLMGPI